MEWRENWALFEERWLSVRLSQDVEVNEGVIHIRDNEIM